MVEIIKPLLKWVGGKTQIIEDVVELIPKEMHNYHEPFIGGGSVLFTVLSYKMYGEIEINGRVYASDINKNLINFYKNIQANVDSVIAELKKIISEYNGITGTDVKRLPVDFQESLTSPESYYYWMRKTYNALNDEQRSEPRASAIFFFINKNCFRGLYRESTYGFNVPYGYYKRPFLIDEQHFRDVSLLIEDVVFTCRDFEKSIQETVCEADFIYLDPPYAPENAASFVSYTSGGFPLDEHNKLFKICNELPCKMLMSNADVKIVRDSFPNEKGFITKTISCRRTINPYDTGSSTNEVLITNYNL